MAYVEEESAVRTMSDNLNIDATVARAAIISETIVFCTLVVFGGGLFALFATTQINWYYPTVFYGVVIYIAWQRYFGISVRVRQATQTTAAQRVVQQDTRGFQRAREQELEEQVDQIRRQTERTDEALRQIAEATREAEVRTAVYSALRTTDYDALTVEEVARRIDGLPAELLKKVREFEKNHKNRETLVAQIDHKIRANS